MKRTAYVLLEIDYDGEEAEREGVTESQLALALVDALDASSDQDFRGRVLTAEEVKRIRP